MGNKSATVYASPTQQNLPTSPIINTVYSQGNNLVINFSSPLSSGGSTITGYQYSLDGGMTWQNAASNIVPYQIIVSNITPNVLYLVTIRAVTASGIFGYKAHPVEYSRINLSIGSIFTGEEDDAWINLDNWLTSDRNPAEYLPEVTTSVTLEADCVVNVDSQLWVTPASINIAAHDIVFNSTQTPRPSVNCNITATTGTSTFNGVDYGIQPVRVGAIFRGNIDTNWFNISNWLTTERLVATQLPVNTVNVTLEHACIVDIDNPDWVQPASISIGSYNITFNSIQTVRPSITCDISATSGTATFNGVDYGA